MDQRKEEMNRVLQAYLAMPEGPQKLWARDDVLKAYDYLILITISRYINVPYGVETDDLEQIGRISLASAIQHYDPNRLVKGKSVQFVTYAIACIRKGISRWIHDSSWSKAAAEHEKAINKASAKLVQEHGRPASITEIAEEMEVSEARLIDMARSTVRNRPLYLHQSSGGALGVPSGETEMHLEDALPSIELDHHTRLVQREQAKILVELAGTLRGNLREAGLLLLNGYSVAEIGELLGVSASRAGMIVSTVRMRLFQLIVERGHREFFSEWLVPSESGLRPGRVRKRRRHPHFALMRGMAA